MPYQPPMAYSLRARQARLEAVQRLIDVGPGPGFFMLYDGRQPNFRLRVEMKRPSAEIIESALVWFCPLYSDEPLMAGNITNLEKDY